MVSYWWIFIKYYSFSDSDTSLENSMKKKLSEHCHQNWFVFFEILSLSFITTRLYSNLSGVKLQLAVIIKLQKKKEEIKSEWTEEISVFCFFRPLFLFISVDWRNMEEDDCTEFIILQDQEALLETLMKNVNENLRFWFCYFGKMRINSEKKEVLEKVSSDLVLRKLVAKSAFKYL